MKFKLKAYSIWEFGQRVDAAGNPHQEDCTYPLPQDLSDDDRLFILCDGMGGHDAGEVASATVCEALAASVLQAQPDLTGQFSDEMFLDSLAAAYDALDKKDTGAVKKMGTTMTFLKLHADGATIAHIGDSRVYHIRPGKTAEETQILFQTRDHSLVNDLLRIGELSPEEAKTYPRKNIITRAMQPNMERRCRADIYHTSDIQAGDIFYLCSDGMLENMEDPQICYNFSFEAGNDTKIVQNLTTATQYNRDNHTAIIIRITEVIPPVAQKAIKPEEETDAVITRPKVFALSSGAVNSFPSSPAEKLIAPKSRSSSNSKVFIFTAIVALIVLLSAIGFYVGNNHRTPQTETPLLDDNVEPSEQPVPNPSKPNSTSPASSNGNPVKPSATYEAGQQSTEQSPEEQVVDSNSQNTSALEENNSSTSPLGTQDYFNMAASGLKNEGSNNSSDESTNNNTNSTEETSPQNTDDSPDGSIDETVNGATGVLLDNQ